MARDKYTCFQDLIAREEEGADYRIETIKHPTSNVAIIAPHGGGIEPGTSQIARAIAVDQHSLALFEGRKTSGNKSLHITSANFDEPQCCEIISSARRVIAIHGEKTDQEIVYIGGRDKNLIGHLAASLARQGFTVSEHDKLKGDSPDNICNRGLTRKGVQLEITHGLRSRLLSNDDPRNSEELLSAFVKAIHQALAE